MPEPQSTPVPPPGGQRPAGMDDPRVFLAAERTLLAWIRTGLAMMGFGFVVARFGLFAREFGRLQGAEPIAGTGFSLWIGTAMVVLGIAASMFAAIEHIRFLHLLPPAEAIERPRLVVSIAIAMLLSVLGVAMVAYLFSL